MAEAGTEQKQVVRRRRKPMTGRIFLVCFAISGVLFLPTTILLAVGMMPTLIAFLVDRSKKRITRAVTIGAMNLAGCSPFVLDLWGYGQSFEKTFSIITQPTSIIVMYFAAAVGHMIGWSMTGIVASLMYERGKQRQVEIKKKQEELIERWGKEVTGVKDLDDDELSLPEVSAESY